MTQSNNHQLLRTTTNKSTTTIIFMVCSTLLIALGAAVILGGPNHTLFTTSMNAKLENAEELSENLRAAIVEEKLQKVVDQNQSNQSDVAASNSNSLILRLDRAHFIPLSPLNGRSGNQAKIMLGYSVQNSSTLHNDNVNAVMEVYARNQTLLRTYHFLNPSCLIIQREISSWLLHLTILLFRM